MNRATLIVLSLIFVFRPLAIYADIPIELVGQRLHGCSYDIAVSRNHAYVAYRSGLHVINISNPALPVIVGSCDLSDSTQSIAISSGYAYVGTWRGLNVISTGNPSSPLLVGRCGTGPIYDVTISGNYVYIADGITNIEVFDISKPLLPVKVGQYTTGCPVSIDISGTYAYVADLLPTTSRLQVFDISNPMSLVLVGTLDDPNVGDVYDIAVSGSYAYLATSNDGLQVIDISNPSFPMLIGGWATGGPISDVEIAGNYVYVASSADFYVIEITNPFSPVWVGGYDNGDVIHNMAVSDCYAYLATERGIVILSVGVDWDGIREVAEKRIAIWKSYYDPAPPEPNKAGWLNPDFWDYMENQASKPLAEASDLFLNQRNAIDDLGNLLTAFLHDSGSIFSNMSGAGNLCLAAIMLGQLYDSMSFWIMYHVISSSSSSINDDIQAMIRAIEQEIGACQNRNQNYLKYSRVIQESVLKQINWVDGQPSTLDDFEGRCYSGLSIEESCFRTVYENFRYLMDSVSSWAKADMSYICDGTRWETRHVDQISNGEIKSLDVGFMVQHDVSTGSPYGNTYIDSLYAAIDLDRDNTLPEGWQICKYHRFGLTSDINWNGIVIESEDSNDYNQLSLTVCNGIINPLFNGLRRDVFVLASLTPGGNQSLWAYQFGVDPPDHREEWRKWGLGSNYASCSWMPVPFIGGDPSNTNKTDALKPLKEAVYFGLSNGYIQEVYWSEGIGLQASLVGQIAYYSTDDITALAIGHGRDYDDPIIIDDQPYQLYVGTSNGYIYGFVYHHVPISYWSRFEINNSQPLNNQVVGLCTGPTGGTVVGLNDGTVFALTENALYAYHHDSSTGTWNRVELTEGSDFSGGISVGMCGAAILASFNEGLYAFTRNAKGKWSIPKRVDNPDEHIYGRIVSDLVASGVRGAYIYNSNKIWNVIQVPNSKPKTPGDMYPQDEIWINDITPEFSWSSFADGGDGDTCEGYQLRVRCDTDGDVIVYDTEYVSTPPYNAHTYDPVTYGGIYLEDGKHYHWHVRYLDSSGDWSDWSSDTPATHQDFYVDTSPDYITDLAAKLWEGGPDLPPNVWRQENDPYFYWTEPVSDAPIEGYYHSLDSIPDSSSDFTTNTYYEFPEDSVPDGEHFFYVRSKDSAGNLGIPVGFNIKVDSTPPTDPLNLDSDNGDDGIWTTEQFHIMLWNPSEPGLGSPLVGYHYTTDGSDPDETSQSTTSNSYGPYEPGFGVSYFKVRAKDLAGNLSNVVTYTHKITYLGDFEPNGDVDTDDLARIADYWLQNESSIDIFPYPGGDNIINFKDFATFADNWLKGTNP